MTDSQDKVSLRTHAMQWHVLPECAKISHLKVLNMPADKGMFLFSLKFKFARYVHLLRYPSYAEMQKDPISLPTQTNVI